MPRPSCRFLPEMPAASCCQHAPFIFRNLVVSSFVYWILYFRVRLFLKLSEVWQHLLP
jgi:hypothetical protein